MSEERSELFFYWEREAEWALSTLGAEFSMMSAMEAIGRDDPEYESFSLDWDKFWADLERGAAEYENEDDVWQEIRSAFERRATILQKDPRLTGEEVSRENLHLCAYTSTALRDIKFREEDKRKLKQQAEISKLAKQRRAERGCR